METKLDVGELKNIAYNEFKVIKYEFEKLRKLYSELKSCCNANTEFVNQDVEEHVEKILFSYFPPGISKEDIMKNMQNLFASYNREGSLRIYLNASTFETVWMLCHIN